MHDEDNMGYGGERAGGKDILAGGTCDRICTGSVMKEVVVIEKLVGMRRSLVYML